MHRTIKKDTIYAIPSNKSVNYKINEVILGNLNIQFKNVNVYWAFQLYLSSQRSNYIEQMYCPDITNENKTVLNNCLN